MCSDDPVCPGSDPKADALWRSNQPALLEIRCNGSDARHLLAKVFNVRGTATLCSREMTLRGDYFGAGQEEGVTFHSQLVPLSEVTWLEYARCKHGTFGFDAGLLGEALNSGANWVEARPTTAGELGSRIAMPGLAAPTMHKRK